MQAPPRTLFFGTGDIAVPALDFLLKQESVSVIGLLCQPDKPVGRKQILTPPATKVLAGRHGVPVFQPDRLRRHVDMVASLKPDLIVVMAYGQIIPQTVLDLPSLGCWNLHASLLPRHRGAAPIQSAILEGDPESGITVMAVEAGLDSGPMLLHESLPLAPDETGGGLHDRLAALAPVALERALPLILSGNPQLTVQDSAQATHIGKLDRSHGVLDWSQPAATLERRIHAFHPWPGTSTTLPDGTPVKIFPPVVGFGDASGGCAPPGALLAAGPDSFLLATGQGTLRIQEIQLPGSRRMKVREHLAGHAHQLGEIWGRV
ncbi:MAG: methionyl-tRNA formyltransferase [Verrucomicrobiaceae bacterium]|nr:MAG: methionyl-tRNA formyltransferase [Verrucomicrobiaceae bacterium]